MKKYNLKMLSAVIIVLLAWTVLSTVAIAAGLTNAKIVTGLTASAPGKTASWSAAGNTVIGEIYGKSGCTGDSAQSETLTLTNSSDDQMILSFSANVDNGGSYAIDTSGDSVNGFVLAKSGTVKITVTSQANSKLKTTLTISDIALDPIVDANATFIPAENGSYTVDGTAITTETSLKKSSAQTYSVAATPASGYKLMGWYSVTNDTFFSNSAQANIRIKSDQTVKPVFVKKDVPVFSVGTKYFTDLNESGSYASSASRKVISLISDGTISGGEYTIPSGVTLLIPFDATNTIYTANPEMDYNKNAAPQVYRTLTLASGASINVENGGAISVPSRLTAYSTGANSRNGSPYGYYGKIYLNNGSSITLNSGSALYCYGFITGKGSVLAKSGSTVWEAFQIRSWRGGNAASGANSAKVFPINQYYIQNIESSLTLEAGATENVYTGANASSRSYSGNGELIGNSGMFRISNGSIEKYYDETTDRLIININGNLSLAPLELDLGVISIDTSSYILPITNNMTINIHSGTATISQDMSLLPSAKINIASEATVIIPQSKSLYVYDVNDWGFYAYANGKMNPINYTAVTSTKRTAASLTNAEIDVNGKLIVKGYLCTTSKGAGIFSSEGTGSIYYDGISAQNKSGLKEVTQSGNNATKVDITTTSAQLLNGDGSYTSTAGAAAGLTFLYHKDTTDDTKSCWYNYTVDWSDGTDTLATDYIAVTETTEDTYTPDHLALTSATASGGSAVAVLNNPAAAFIDGASYDDVAESVTVSGIDADTVVALAAHPYQFKNAWTIYTRTDSIDPVTTSETHYVNSTTDYYDFGKDDVGQEYIVREPGGTNTTTYVTEGGTIAANGSKAVITGLTKNVTAYADGRNYSWYVSWLENNEAKYTDYLKTGETTATYNIPDGYVYQGTNQPEGSPASVVKTNKTVTVTPVSDTKINVTTAKATDTYTFFIGDMDFELFANSVNYYLNGDTMEWEPGTSSYAWRAASGTESVTYEGERYSVNNGTIKLVNLSNQVVDMTVSLTNTAEDENITQGQLIFTAPDGTTWNDTQKLTLMPGDVKTITVAVDDTALDPNEIVKTLDKVNFGTISVETAVNNTAER